MIAGGFDVSISAVAVAAPLVALRIENATGSVVLAILAGCVFGLLVGVVNGSVVSFAKINSFITTLATSFIVFGIGFLVSDRSIMRPESEEYRNIARTRVAELTTATWISLGVVAIAWITLSATRFGRHVYATGGNLEAAKLAGVRTGRIIVLAFALSGLAAGLAGVVASSRPSAPPRLTTSASSSGSSPPSSSAAHPLPAAPAQCGGRFWAPCSSPSWSTASTSTRSTPFGSASSKEL